MKIGNIIICIMSGLGFVLSIIGFALSLASGVPFFPEFTIAALAEHPLVGVAWTGILFYIIVRHLITGNKKKN